MQDQISEEIIRVYPNYFSIADPTTIITFGVITAILSGVWFARIMQIKLINWEKKKIPPTPLERMDTIISWTLAFFGVTLFFTGMLEVFAFSPIKSLLASISICLFSGFSMWRVIQDLMVQLEAGEVKEIDEYF
tara:strand:+ start:549 stop:950 length:402 start_codon:yes stop_codon:yes gene_type:complete